jgi:hypothetical protein
MALLAAVAIGYSLTAELSLMAQTRGDTAAEREAVGDGRRMALERHRRANAELVALAPSRPAGELQALLGGLDCDDGAKVRALCAELGRATRRAELEAALAKAETDSVTRPAVAAADAGAASLSALLAVFGVTIPAAVLGHWLVLVGVVALEAGSALAVVLCRANVALTQYIVTQERGISVTTPAPSRKPGRRPIGDRAMSGAERQKRFREAARASVASNRLN